MVDAPLLPLPFSAKNWRSRWMHCDDGQTIHRLARIHWQDEAEKIEGSGLAVCGRGGRFTMPGIFSRMGAWRCPRCCKALGIPRGYGAPGNTTETWKDA